MLPSAYFNPPAHNNNNNNNAIPGPDLASLLSLFPATSLPPPVPAPSELLDFPSFPAPSPSPFENIWLETLDDLWGYACAQQASLGIQVDASRGVGRFRDLIKMGSGTGTVEMREVYGASVGAGDVYVDVDEEALVGQSKGTHV